jgi:hypothetical protein
MRAQPLIHSLPAQAASFPSRRTLLDEGREALEQPVRVRFQLLEAKDERAVRTELLRRHGVHEADEVADVDVGRLGQRVVRGVEVDERDATAGNK